MSTACENGIRFKRTSDISGIAWKTYPKNTDVSACLDEDFPVQIAHPGQPFALRACIRRTKTRILITQFVGLDV